MSLKAKWVIWKAKWVSLLSKKESKIGEKNANSVKAYSVPNPMIITKVVTTYSCYEGDGTKGTCM